MAERLWTVYLGQSDNDMMTIMSKLNSTIIYSTHSHHNSTELNSTEHNTDLHLSAAVESEAKDWAGEGKLNCRAEGNPETVALTSLTLQFFRIPFRLRPGDIASVGEEEGGDLCSETLNTSNLLGLRSVFGSDIRAVR